MIISPPPLTPSPTLNSPTPSLVELQGPTSALATLLSGAGLNAADGPHYRTTTNIVLSCLTTIVACTWVALHMNVPESNPPAWKCFLWKTCVMSGALMAPEVVAARAVRERLIARRYMDEWNVNFVSLCSPERVAIRGKTKEQYKRELKDKNYDSRWTLTHGFLAGMGGIRFYDDGDENPKKFEPTQAFFKDPKMQPIIQQIGLISSKDIQDKSKGDWVSKVFIVVQTTWFIIQCLARWATHLPVTELEVVTLAYAIQNIVVYFFWWDKPQNVSVPYCLYLEKDRRVSEEQAARGASEQEKVPLMQYPLSSTLVDVPLNLDALPECEIPRSRSRSGPRWKLSHNEWVQPIHSRRHGFFTKLFGGDRHVLFLILAGILFGCLHLIPIWYPVFPSDTERIMWEISAIYITVAPVAGLVGWLIFVVVPRSPYFYAILFFDGVFVACIAGAYAVARVILLVLPLITLVSLPTEAFLSVEWTRFIPHF